MFDNYTLKARFYPVIILFLPIVVLGAFYSFEFEDVIHFFSSIGILSALTYLFSQVGRDQGKKKEPKLWENWGGTPSVQLLRLSDNHIDKHTKQRYHKKLQLLFPVTTLPDEVLEANNSNEADEVYKAWSKYLVTQTRDVKKYSLIYKENISYGFRRNLWGLKNSAIVLVVSLLLCNYGFWVFKTKSFNPLNFSELFIYSNIALFLILFFWIFIVNRNWVKIVAFAYASRLCEGIEAL